MFCNFRKIQSFFFNFCFRLKNIQNLDCENVRSHRVCDWGRNSVRRADITRLEMMVEVNWVCKVDDFLVF